LAASDPNTINGYSYVINNDMPQIGRNGSPLVGNNFMLFGDMSKYKVRRVAGDTTVMRLNERYADYLQVGYQAFLRADAQLLDAGTHPIAVLVQAAS
jgi:HK97 family phage major capsid protein